MDTLSQGLLGAAAAAGVARGDRVRVASVVGALSAMAPDLDVFIRSSTDPLLFLEYHRQFTHSLAFIPIGAFVCACIFRPWTRRRMTFAQTFGFCLVGYATHGLLDACTSYGTQLVWPFSNRRVAWNNVSVVDPLFSVGLLAAVAVAVRRRAHRIAWLACVWAVVYLLVGVAQRERAEAAGLALAQQRGHVPVVEAKPAFGSLLLWKTMYRWEGRYYVDAVRMGRVPQPFPGESVAVLEVARDLPWLSPNSRQFADLERFRRFSDGWVALDPDRARSVIDVRYSLVPNRIEALWGIALDAAAPDDRHVEFYASRDMTAERRAEVRRMLFGSPIKSDATECRHQSGLRLAGAGHPSGERGGSTAPLCATSFPIGSKRGSPRNSSNAERQGDARESG